MEEKTIYGNSFLCIVSETLIGLARAVSPRINVILTIFDPMTLPMAISAVCPGSTVSEAAKLTASSGNDVPKATNVKPITSGETLNFLAIELDEETKKSAPLTSATNPITNSNTLNT